jgi:hypothetical protein
VTLPGFLVKGGEKIPGAKAIVPFAISNAVCSLCVNVFVLSGNPGMILYNELVRGGGGQGGGGGGGVLNLCAK